MFGGIGYLAQGGGCLRLLGHQDGRQLLGCPLVGTLRRFAARGFRGKARIVLGIEQLVGDALDRSAHVLDGLREPLAPGAQLLDLGMEHPTAPREIGQHPGAKLLGLLDHSPALLAGPFRHQFDLVACLVQRRGHLLVRPLPQLPDGLLDLR